MTHFAVAVIAEDDQRVDGLLAPYMENCCAQPDYMYMEFYEDDECDVDESTGKRGYWQNPNATWDWWVEGGRFEGWAKEFIGGTSVRISDIRYPSGEQRRKAEQWYDENVDEDGNRRDVFVWTWGYARGMTREQLAFVRSRLTFRCVVTPDGEWHECGDTGWFGYYSEGADDMYEWAKTFGERFLEPYGDCTLTVVDCHI